MDANNKLKDYGAFESASSYIHQLELQSPKYLTINCDIAFRTRFD